MRPSQEWASSETSRREGTRAGAGRESPRLQVPVAETTVSGGVLATAKNGKAAGPGALPAELLKAGGKRLLPHLARLAAGAMMAGSLEVAGRPNGRVPKKAMLPFTLQNSRGSLCANVAGKIVAKVVRSQLVGPLATEAGARQHGACLGVGPSFHRMLATCTRRRRRGSVVQRQCSSRT